jgi:hypothetical protein
MLVSNTPRSESMTPQFLPAFGGWLHTLGEDVLSLAHLLESPDAPEPFRSASAESLSYLLRVADLIPEGIEQLGYLEVAFAFRALARRAMGDAEPSSLEGRVPRLAVEAATVVDFLEEDVALFWEMVFAPAALSRVGRPASDVLEDEELRVTTLQQARAWVEQYRAPELSEGEEELVKIRSFFRTRLRRAS